MTSNNYIISHMTEVTSDGITYRTGENGTVKIEDKDEYVLVTDKNGSTLSIPWDHVDEWPAQLKALQDRAGNELKVGDRVLYLETSGNDRVNLEWATVDRFTPQRVALRIEGVRPTGEAVTWIRFTPAYRIVKPFRSSDE